MAQFNMVAQTSECTVVAEYTPEESKSDAFQSEAALEAEFIKLLSNQGYDYLAIHSEADLIINLREQLERLNGYHFSADEWDRFFHNNIANAAEGIVEKTRKIQEDYVQVLKRDDGTSMNIMLIDKKNIHNNRTQVINQYVNNEGRHDNRYDVTILVNGLPLVHVELKKRGVALKEAFNQIERYQRDSFWAGNGLYEYIQIFVISNGTYTKYYSNTTRFSHIEQSKGSQGKKTSNSFEFTSYWADGSNRIIPDLVDFTKTFFARHTILAILTKYCVFTSEDLLLVMRPYQIAATERILNRIEIATNYKKYGTTDGGGYIWHTTGSGKTLTSFKTAQLATKMPEIDKVLFVVDRKDLDYQTMREYDRFEKGSANGNSSTAVLQRQLENRDEKGNPHDYRIIITTIQKLGNFVSRNKTHPVYDKHVVIIFDECHRSQFGDMHYKIVKAFKKYHIFGFTGTPIFAENAKKGKHLTMLTTPQTFGDCLHTYTIVDAINDGNVLPFRIDYINTVKQKEGIDDKQVSAIDIERAMMAPERISEIVSYTLEHFDQKTKRGSSYSLKDKRVNGFNSIFACASIPAAKLYYNEFKKQIKETGKDLVIATIFSCAANEADPDDAGGFLDEENFETEGLDLPSRDFLDKCISDYNATFSTNFDSSGEKFQNYYRDLSQRVKNREVDILIVVNMFLTGFDATTLNTLWVDKNLKQHGLIQAFSRTNRILNSVKTFGNIVCFRNLQNEVDDAVALFGDRDAGGIIILKNFEAYYYGFDENGKHYDGYVELVEQIEELCPPGELPYGEKAEKEFIRLFSGILSCRNILSAFDQFDPDTAISEREMQDYQSIYLELYDKYRRQKNDGDKENINDDIVFEIELIKQVDINIDYILALVAKMHAQNCVDRDILAAVLKVVESSLALRSKKALIEQFILTVNVGDGNLNDDWKAFVESEAYREFEKIVREEKLKKAEAEDFMARAFHDGEIRETGTDIVAILPPTGRFGANNLAAVKARVIEKLKAFFEKYFGLGIFENKELVDEGTFSVEDTGREPKKILKYDMEPEQDLVADSSFEYAGKENEK